MGDWDNWRLNLKGKAMALYLVVRHPQNPHQTFENRWQNDELLTSIQTTLEVANRCIEARTQNQWVYIHRCGYNGVEPMICCSVRVADVEEIGGWIIVNFIDQTRLVNSTPSELPSEGDNSYESFPRT
jgi:hypothetical protein